MAEKGYIFIDRQYSQDLAVVYPSVERARVALTEDMLIDGFCEDDCLDAFVPDMVTEDDLSYREVLIVEEDTDAEEADG